MGPADYEAMLALHANPFTSDHETRRRHAAGDYYLRAPPAERLENHSANQQSSPSLQRHGNDRGERWIRAPAHGRSSETSQALSQAEPSR